jgi:SAM-dependent methyltransferase
MSDLATADVPPAGDLSMMDNQEIYSTKEFAQWAHREGLEPGEAYLIERFLDPSAKTLEGGTGGGRLLLAMQSRGFEDLHGFDFVPALIEAAKSRDVAGTIDFRVQDATELDYVDSSFDQLVYLQQILCLISPEEARRRALMQAYRILRPGGRAVFSLLSFRARSQSWAYKPMLNYLRLFRAVTGARRSMQNMPWLRLDGSSNWGALLDRGPYVYWYREREANDLLVSVGFQVTAVGCDAQIDQGRLLSSVAQLEAGPMRGRLYFVCQK